MFVMNITDNDAGKKKKAWTYNTINKYLSLKSRTRLEQAW